MPAGFIYVLINPAMPGLAKVGKTTRDPAARVIELSNATGVPTPFVLAFQQPVTDCDFAEVWLHKELENEGYRIANNREFFNAPLHVIIQKLTTVSNLKPQSNLDDERIPILENDTSEQENLAAELCNLGRLYRDGTDSQLANPVKALKYFEQAAALGSAPACSQAAGYYHFGDTKIQVNLEKALFYYIKSVNLGNWHEEIEIAKVLLENNQKTASMSRWKHFFERAVEEIENGPNDRFEEDHPIYSHHCSILGNAVWHYFTLVMDGEISNLIPDSIFYKFRDYVVDHFCNLCDLEDELGVPMSFFGIKHVPEIWDIFSEYQKLARTSTTSESP
jgi:T5orf172 domain/Sel1 repeat